MGRPSESSIVAKCALVMDILSSARQPLGFSEIVSQTGFVKSSCHRILAVLQSEALIEYDKKTRLYRTGGRLRKWARSAWLGNDLQQVAGEVVNGLSDSTGLNVALSVLDNETILYLLTANQLQVRYAARAGDHAPLHCTAAGKVFLAHLPDNQRKQLLDGLRFEKYTEFTKTSATDLIHELLSTVSKGYAIASKEEFLQVTGIAAPIRNEQDEVVACLSLWAQDQLASGEQVKGNAGALIDAANSISKKIGWRSIGA